MRTYISRKYSFAISYVALILAVIFFVLGVLMIVDLVFFQHSDVAFICIIPLTVALGLYPAYMSRMVYIEDGKIIAKGIFSKASFDINDFKDVTRDFWGSRGSYLMRFHSGRKYWFYPSMPKGRKSYFPYVERSIADDIYDQINSMK